MNITQVDNIVFSRLMDFDTVINFITSPFAFYAVLTTKSKESPIYKGWTMMAQLFILLTGVLITVTVKPIFLLHHGVTYSEGYSNYFKVPYYIQMTMACVIFGTYCLSLMATLLIRLVLVSPVDSLLRNNNVFWSITGALWLIINPPSATLFYISSYRTGDNFNLLEEFSPGLAQRIVGKSFILLTMKLIESVIYLCYLGALVALTIIVICYCAYSTFATVKAEEAGLSNVTVKYHLRVLRNLLIQLFCIMTSILAVPLLMLTASYVDWSYGVMQSALFVFGLAPTISAVSLIGLNSGYRKTILGILRKRTNITKLTSNASGPTVP